MHHRICGISPYGLSDLSEGDMHAACIVYIPRCSTAFFTYFNAQCISRIFVLSTFHCVVWHPLPYASFPSHFVCKGSWVLQPSMQRNLVDCLTKLCARMIKFINSSGNSLLWHIVIMCGCCCTPHPHRGVEYCDEHVCLSVHLCVCLCVWLLLVRTSALYTSIKVIFRILNDA